MIYTNDISKQSFDMRGAAIKQIKGNMNRQRTDFNLPKDHYKITRNWLLGFVEGEMVDLTILLKPNLGHEVLLRKVIIKLYLNQLPNFYEI